MNPMVITNQISIIDNTKKERKKPKYNTKDSHQIRERVKEERNRKTYKTFPEQLTKWQ